MCTFACGAHLAHDRRILVGLGSIPLPTANCDWGCLGWAVAPPGVRMPWPANEVAGGPFDLCVLHPPYCCCLQPQRRLAAWGWGSRWHSAAGAAPRRPAGVRAPCQPRHSAAVRLAQPLHCPAGDAGGWVRRGGRSVGQSADAKWGARRVTTMHAMVNGRAAGGKMLWTLCVHLGGGAELRPHSLHQ